MVRKKYQSGQIALIALLVLTIATTVGLSLIARTTTDVSVTRNIEESTRAFSAAEAGVEEALKSGIAGSGDTDPSLGVSYVTTITNAGGTADPFVFPQKTLKEDTETLWLVDHNADGTVDDTQKVYTANTIDVCWSSESTTPALVVAVLYKTSGSYQVAKVASDPDGSRANNFSPPAATIGSCPTSTSYRSRITFGSFVPVINPAQDTLIALRIRPVYSGALIAVAPAQELPVQGNNIESVGTAGGDVNRKIIVYQQYRAPESIFDYAVYSENNFSQ